jgi:AraC family transcriptional regulator, regulatory protein of adaptative response / methylated-DNA-[protein]-cysteine methyltransferase
MPQTNRPPEDLSRADQYARIEHAIAFLRANRACRPSLDVLAAHLGLSSGHVQRLFSRWAGVSPKRFLQLLTIEHAKRRMRETASVLDVALDAGLSGPGRLHDLFVSLEAVSPGEFRSAGTGLRVVHGVGDSPFGPAGVATTARGVCDLAFVDPVAHDDWLAPRRRQWPQADWVEDTGAAQALLDRVFAPDPSLAGRGLSVWVGGTNFQVQVWRALLRIPPAGLASYGQLARMAGRPGAARAVGGALARNPVAFLVPCHRVLREDGDFGHYHWGGDRKRAICAWEAARQAVEAL